jgi:hypothetical protein
MGLPACPLRDILAGTQGFEPRYAAPEAAVLPLDDVPTSLCHPQIRAVSTSLCEAGCQPAADCEPACRVFATTPFILAKTLLSVTNSGRGTSRGALRFAFAHDGGTLTVRVADKHGNPISDAYVAIVPESAATEAEMSAVMTVGPTSLNGVYSASALSAGKMSRAGDERDYRSGRKSRCPAMGGAAARTGSGNRRELQGAGEAGAASTAVQSGTEHRWAIGFR